MEFEPYFPVPCYNIVRHVFGEATLAVYYLHTLCPQETYNIAMEEILRAMVFTDKETETDRRLTPEDIKERISNLSVSQGGKGSCA